MYITLSQFLYINFNVYILHRKYQVKFHSSLRFSAVYGAALVHRNHFFICTINLVNLKESSDRLVIVENRFLKMPNLHMLIKQKSPLLLRNLALVTWRIANSVLNKGKSAIPPLFNGPEVLSSASDKAKLFAKNFSKNSYLDDSGISVPVFLLELI